MTYDRTFEELCLVLQPDAAREMLAEACAEIGVQEPRLIAPSDLQRLAWGPLGPLLGRYGVSPQLTRLAIERLSHLAALLTCMQSADSGTATSA